MVAGGTASSGSISDVTGCVLLLLANETHSNPGKTKAFEDKLLQLGFRAFWSHGGNRRAGVGILIRHEFLALFNSMPPQWIDISPGEMACLQLTGSSGNLDLFSIYFPTGNQATHGSTLTEKRNLCRSILANHIRPNNESLSIVGGDLDFCVAMDDRSIDRYISR